MSFSETTFEVNFGKMYTDWEIVTLQEICLKEKGSIISGPFGSNISKKYFVESGVPVIRGNNLTKDLVKFVDKGFVFVTPEKAEALKTYARINDLVFTAAGTIGQVGIINDKCKYQEYIISNKQLRATPDTNIVYPLYAYYWFSNPKMDSYINKLNTGSTIPLINLTILKGLPIPLPSIDIQKNIANILSSLDEKIELNNQMNKILEEMAQALFKRWFVDFEFPNEDGKPYKSSGGEMVNSELGMIPKGWEVKKFGDILENYDSKRVPLSKREREKRENIYPYYGAASIADYVDNYIFDGTYILMGEDGTVIDNEGFPILQYVWGKFWVNNHAHVLQGKNNISSEFVYLYLKRTNVTHLVTGAVQPKINQKNMNSLNVVLANKVLLNMFDSIISGMFAQIKNLTDESKQLVEIRDALLPKLMSGEVRLSDIEN